VKIIRTGAAALMLGVALAGSAFAASRVPAGFTAAEWRADRLRSAGLDQKYHLGTFRTQASVPQAWLRALQIRSEALNRKYHLGRYAVSNPAPSPASGFDWGAAGVGSAVTLGFVLIVFGVATGTRRYRDLRQNPVV
jgi:hypothetical protein